RRLLQALRVGLVAARARLAIGVRRRAGARRLLLQAVLHAPHAIGEPFLFARETALRVLPTGRAVARTRRLRCDLPLRIGQLPRFELQVAERAPPAVRRSSLQLPLEIAQPLERTRGTSARLPGILPSQIAGRVAHLLRDISHLT